MDITVRDVVEVGGFVTGLVATYVATDRKITVLRTEMDAMTKTQVPELRGDVDVVQRDQGKAEVGLAVVAQQVANLSQRVESLEGQVSGGFRTVLSAIRGLRPQANP